MKTKINVTDCERRGRTGRPRKHATEEAKRSAIKTSKLKHWHKKYGKANLAERIERLEKQRLVSVTIGEGESGLEVRVRKLEEDVYNLKWQSHAGGMK